MTTAITSLPQRKTDLPLKNRVVVFEGVTGSCTGVFASQVVGTHQEISTTSTTIVSGVFEWLSKDPIGISGGLNQYVFCSDNPVNYRDPLGLVDWGLLGRSVVGVVANSVVAVAGAAVVSTGVGVAPGAVLAVYGAYGVGSHAGNIVNAIWGFQGVEGSGGQAGPTGPASAASQGVMLAAGMDPSQRAYRNVDYGAQVVDIAVPLVASGRVEWERLPTVPMGTPGSLGGAVNQVVQNPAAANAVVKASIALDAGATAWNSAAAAYGEAERCPK